MPKARAEDILGPWIGYFLGLGATAGILWAALTQGTSPRLNILIVITGGLIGWAVGMLMTPVSAQETKQFPEYGKAISTFISGYLVAKLDKVFDLSMKDGANINELVIERILMFVGAFVLGTLFTYVWRSYFSRRGGS